MSEKIKLSITQQEPYSLALGINRDGSGGTSNYEALTNKPRINGVELIGNKTSSEIYVQDLMEEVTPQDIDKIIYGG